LTEAVVSVDEGAGRSVVADPDIGIEVDPTCLDALEVGSIRITP